VGLKTKKINGANFKNTREKVKTKWMVKVGV